MNNFSSSSFIFFQIVVLKYDDVMVSGREALHASRTSDLVYFHRKKLFDSE